MDEDTVVEIQTKIAFLENANAELGDVLYRQQQEIKSLEGRVAELSERLESARFTDRERPVDDERPPHY